MSDREGKEPLKSYRDLIVWQKGMDLVVTTYQLTQKLPRDERFGLKSQMRDAVISIPSNIAEGYCRRHRGEYLQFLGIANGSLGELETQMIAAGRLNFVTREDVAAPWALAQDVGRLLSNLMDSLQ